MHVAEIKEEVEFAQATRGATTSPTSISSACRSQFPGVHCV
jgi:hypothetical protein